MFIVRSTFGAEAFLKLFVVFAGVGDVLAVGLAVVGVVQFGRAIVAASDLVNHRADQTARCSISVHQGALGLVTSAVRVDIDVTHAPGRSHACHSR